MNSRVETMTLPLDSFDMVPEEVRRRFRSAVRRGEPAWLWPEVPKESWRAALGLIAQALGEHLETGASTVPLDGDPLAFGLACYTSGTGPLLGWWHEQGTLAASPAIAFVLDLHLKHNRARTARLESGAFALVRALVAVGINVVVLKGSHTAAYFPDPATRPASDIDLLVEPSQFDAAEAVLRDRGFVATSKAKYEHGWRHKSLPMEPRSLWLVHAEDPWSVDLHRSLNLVVGRGLPQAELDLGEPMASRGRWPPSPDARNLGQPLLLLHLAVHAGAGLHNLTLLRLVEICLIIRADEAAGRLSWDALLDLAGRTRSLGYAYPALRLCDQLLPGTVPNAVLARCAGHAPPGVLRILETLTPATAQRVDRSSVAEHYMWAGSWSHRLRQMAYDVAPSRSAREVGPIYRKRAWQLMRGTIGR